MPDLYQLCQHQMPTPNNKQYTICRTGQNRCYCQNVLYVYISRELNCPMNQYITYPSQLIVSYKGLVQKEDRTLFVFHNVFPQFKNDIVTFQLKIKLQSIVSWYCNMKGVVCHSRFSFVNKE